VQYGEKRETSRVADAMDERKINAIRVVEAPNLAYRPESPKPLRNLILGVIFGILAGLSYAFASNYLSQPSTRWKTSNPAFLRRWPSIFLTCSTTTCKACAAVCLPPWKPCCG
jgi:hypothetical protein